jgi:hypothetical protein
MTVWNGAKYIAESIDSILRQTFEDFELIIIVIPPAGELPCRLILEERAARVSTLWSLRARYEWIRQAVSGLGDMKEAKD